MMWHAGAHLKESHVAAQSSAQSGDDSNVDVVPGVRGGKAAASGIQVLVCAHTCSVLSDRSWTLSALPAPVRWRRQET
jgi:hypothetical protein